MANPQPIMVSTYVGGAGAAQSGFVTFSFVMTSDYFADIDVQINSPGTTSISAGAEVTAYRGVALGTPWETDGTFIGIFSKPTAASQVQHKTVRLQGPGYFLVAVQIGGGSASTWTAQWRTAQVMSAYA